MLQYQLSMTLADMRIRELVAQAERHALLTAARRDSTDTTTLTTRVKHAADEDASAPDQGADRSGQRPQDPPA